MNAAKLWPAVIIAIGLVGVGWWWFQPSGDSATGAIDADAPTVEVAEVKAGPDDDLRRLETRVEAAENVPLPSPLRGAVQDIEVSDGQQVDEGELLLSFEQSSQRAELMAARAEVSLLEAELERTKRDAEENLAAEEEIEDLELRLDAARQQLDDALAAVEANNIRAPFAATVQLADLAPGDIVERGAPIVELSSAGQRVVRLELPRQLTTDIEVGGDVTVVGGEGEIKTDAEIMALGTPPGAEATTVQLTAVLGNPEAFPADSEAVVEIPVTEVQTAVVPPAAVLEDETGVRVFRIESGLARSTPVEKGRATEQGLRVRGPLNPGDMVAVTGLEQLADGMRVAIAGEAAP